MCNIDDWKPWTISTSAFYFIEEMLSDNVGGMIIMSRHMGSYLQPSISKAYIVPG